MNIMSLKGIGILLKFIDEKYIDSTIENGFFFNTLYTFKKSDGLTEEQADSDEGSRVDFNLPKSAIEICDKNHKKIGELSRAEITNWKLKKDYGFTLKIPICCFTILRFPHDFEFVAREKNTFEFKINTKVKAKLDGISDGRPFIYSNLPSVLEQLSKEIKNGEKIMYSKVEYYKSKGINIDEEQLDKNPYKVIFLKNEKYKNQKEFRVALYEKKESTFYKIPEVEWGKSNDANLDRLRMYIVKYSNEKITIQLADKYEEIVYC